MAYKILSADDRQQRAGSGPTLLMRLWQEHALLTFMSMMMIPFTLVALIGLGLDHQVIVGAPAWMKPFKFAISIFIYCLSFVYLLSFVRGHQRATKTIGTLTALSLAVEIVLITLQVLRGTSSHFNFTTPFDSVVFETMGGAVAVLWLAGAVLAVFLLLQRLPDPAWAWALRFSIIIALAGMLAACLMLVSTPSQMASIPQKIMGAHSVGVADGGPGLPILGWSTIGGDLRIPHFFGLHGLQVLLVVGWLVNKTRSWLSTSHRVPLVVTAGAGYLIFIGLLTWQALRAQSIIHPDLLSLLTFGGLFSIALVISASILIHGAKRSMAQASAPIA